MQPRNNVPLIRVKDDVCASLANLLNTRPIDTRSFEERLETIRNAVTQGQHLALNDYQLLFAAAARFAFNALKEPPNPSSFATLLLSKHERYGAAPLRAWGALGIVIRLHSKYERYRTVVNNTSQSEEPAWDTLVDMMGYAVLGDCLVQEQLAERK